jgi:hypothetical protein
VSPFVVAAAVVLVLLALCVFWLVVSVTRFVDGDAR